MKRPVGIEHRLRRRILVSARPANVTFPASVFCNTHPATIEALNCTSDTRSAFEMKRLNRFISANQRPIVAARADHRVESFPVRVRAEEHGAAHLVRDGRAADTFAPHRETEFDGSRFLEAWITRASEAAPRPSRGNGFEDAQLNGNVHQATRVVFVIGRVVGHYANRKGWRSRSRGDSGRSSSAVRGDAHDAYRPLRDDEDLDAI
jgi:hypothetical protein